MTDLATLESRYEDLKGRGLSLDLTRGKPAPDQLDLSNELDGILGGDFIASDGTDTRNYGALRGIPEARELGAKLLGLSPEDVIAGGNSSLTLMYFVVSGAQSRGLCGPAWGDGAKALCPVPGYDRHFTLAESLGIELINVPMTDDGPDMDMVERLVADDPHIKCMWCVPKYSNPTGVTYSDATVERIAKLGNIAAEGFITIWDNAYAVHDLDLAPPHLASVMDAAKAAGTENSIVLFASTSKVTFAGSGISFVGASSEMLEAIERVLSTFMIGPDKVNQLRHARFLAEYLPTLMQRHAESARPKFEAVEKALSEALGNRDIARWTKPKGGYFVSLDTRPGLASAVIDLAREAGVVLTPAGATFPYGRDPDDSNIRIAPTFASLTEVEKAMEVLVACIELATKRAAS